MLTVLYERHHDDGEFNYVYVNVRAWRDAEQPKYNEVIATLVVHVDGDEVVRDVHVEQDSMHARGDLVERYAKAFREALAAHPAFVERFRPNRSTLAKGGAA